MLDNKQDVTTITTEPVIQNFDVCINKIDDQDQTSLAGAQLQVTAADGTVVDEWVSMEHSIGFLAFLRMYGIL